MLFKKAISNNSNVCVYDIFTKEQTQPCIVTPEYKPEYNKHTQEYIMPYVSYNHMCVLDITRNDDQLMTFLNNFIDAFYDQFYAKNRHHIYLPLNKEQRHHSLMVFCDEHQLFKKLIWYNNMPYHMPIDHVNHILNTCPYKFEIIPKQLLVGNMNFTIKFQLKRINVNTINNVKYTLSLFDRQRINTIVTYKNLDMVGRPQYILGKDVKLMLHKILTNPQSSA